MFTRLKIKDLTVFQKAEIELSQGLNVFIGENGSGKTHLLKATYCIPPGLAQEGDLLFDFPEDWQVSQYDTWSYYRNRFQRLLHRIRRWKAKTAGNGLDGQRPVP